MYYLSQIYVFYWCGQGIKKAFDISFGRNIDWSGGYGSVFRTQAL